MPVGEIRAIARNLMPQFITQGLSSRQITSYLKSNYGQAYKRTTLLSDMREFSGLEKYQKQTEAYATTQKFSQAIMSERELKQEYKYYIRGKVTYEDIETGETFERWGSMYTDTWGSKDDWLQEYDKYQVESGSDFTVIPVSWDIVSVSHYSGRPY